jgi:hypothetical protein
VEPIAANGTKNRNLTCDLLDVLSHDDDSVVDLLLNSGLLEW